MWSQQWESRLRSPGKVWAQESTHLCPIRLIQFNHMSQIALQSRTARTGWTLHVIPQSGCTKRTWIKTLFSWELLVSLSSTRQIIFHLLFRSSQAKQKIKTELRDSAGSVRIHLWILLDKTCFENCLFLLFLNYSFEMSTMRINKRKKSSPGLIYSGQQNMPSEARELLLLCDANGWEGVWVDSMEGQESYRAWTTAPWVCSPMGSLHCCLLK